MKKGLIVLMLVLITSNTLLADTGSAESAAGSLTSMPPEVPKLNNPSDGAIDVFSSEVTWNSVTHAASYNLQASTVSNFATTIADETGLTGINYSIPGLSGSTQYFWHVSATNVAGTSDYSETWDFTTDVSLPTTLSSFYAIVVSQGVLLKWITESETDNLGFILERSESSGTCWKVIASYQTQKGLVGQGNTSSRTEYEFTDKTVTAGFSYQYRLSDVDINGDVHIYDVIQITLSKALDYTTLEAPFPNPFNPQTKISYSLSESDHVEIAVFDILGRKVQTLFDDYQSAGSYNIYWHGEGENGNNMATGTYVIALQTADGVKTQKVVMMR